MLTEFLINSGVIANSYILIAVHGVGDTYAVASLCKKFKELNCPEQNLVLLVKRAHVELAAMFEGINILLPFEDCGLGHPDDRRERNADIRPEPGKPFFTHPSVAHIRPDLCVAWGRMCDIAMYAMILGLHPDLEPERPRRDLRLDEEAREIAQRVGIRPGRTVVMISQASSWPSPPPGFFELLSSKLQREGWLVIENGPWLPFRCVIPLLEIAGWAVGANCGIMQMIVSSQTHCRKTILTTAMWPDFPDAHRHLLPIDSTLPYRSFRRIDGKKYDIEEFRIDGYDSHERLTDHIVCGRNARGTMPSPEPLNYLEVDGAPGEVLDKMTILEVKVQKLPERAHLFYREIAYYAGICERLLQKHPEIDQRVQRLRYLNAVAWDHNEILIRIQQRNGIAIEAAVRDTASAFQAANAANQERVRIKNEIDAIFNAGMREEKSYL
jgi:hypothetical protein